MARSWLVLASVAASLLAAGCSGAGGSGAVTGGAAGSGEAVGKNLVGEDCRATAASEPVDPGAAAAPANILCGTRSTLAGVVHTAALPLDTPEPGPDRRAAVERAAQQTQAAHDITAKMICQPGRWLSGDTKSEALIAACVLRDGN